MMTRMIRYALFALVLGGASLSFAQPAADAPKKADSEGFVPVTNEEQLGRGEVMPASRLVGTAYGFILAAIVVWTASVAVRTAKVEAEVEGLRKKIGG